MKIEGVEIFDLKCFYDKRGAIFRIMRNDDPFWMAPGEIYCSYIKPKMVKAWHLHKEMTLNYAVPNGTIFLVLFDTRKDSPSYGQKEIVTLGVAGAYSLIRIPPLIWNGFKSISSNRGALVINVANMSHDPEEVIRVPPDELIFEGRLAHDWGPYEAGW